MKSIFAFLGVVVAVVALYLHIFPFGARADRSFDAGVSTPAYADRHPVMLFDEGHYNAHRASGKYAPFVKLMRNDGYEVREHEGPFTAENLRDADVLVIVNASGGSNPQVFGINLGPLRTGERDAPAFSAAEIDAITHWVREGGALLLIADHYPFGSAAASLAAALGVTMHGGFADVANQYPNQIDSGAIQFSRANGLLADHPIANGRTETERVNLVMSFTGQSLNAPGESILLGLPASATEAVPPPPTFKEQAAGNAQGAALELGRGRVVVLGEAGMLTAQIDGDTPFGMNVAGIDNRQFALNVAHWLSRLL
jgi:hypothetical protein